LEGTVRFLNSKVPALARRGLPAPPEVGPWLFMLPQSRVRRLWSRSMSEERVRFLGHRRGSHKLLKPRLGCPMTGPSVRGVVDTIQRLLPADADVKIGIELPGTITGRC